MVLSFMMEAQDMYNLSLFFSSTADILLNFSEHPPLKLPTEGFILDFETGPSDPSFYHYLDEVKRAMSAGNQMVLNFVE